MILFIDKHSPMYLICDCIFRSFLEKIFVIRPFLKIGYIFLFNINKFLYSLEGINFKADKIKISLLLSLFRDDNSILFNFNL